MKLLVTVKRTPQRDARIRVAPGGASLALEGVQFEVNPFDELAVEEALRIREARGDVEVVVATAGGGDSEQQLVSALAMGADRAVRIDAGETLDSLGIAHALAGLVRREAPDLVLSGKLAVDDEAGQIPAMLAALLGWPQAQQASRVELDAAAKTAQVTCEVDAGLEIVEVDLPAVITADLRLNEPRYASLPGIMKAKKKPLEVVPMSDLAPSGPQRARVLGYRPLPPKTPGVRVASVRELVAALKEKKLI